MTRKSSNKSSKFFATTALSSASVEWGTPAWLPLAVLKACGFEQFGTDPCCGDEWATRVPATVRYTEADDGLKQSWSGPVFCNPPYKRYVIDRWLMRCLLAWQSGEAGLVFALVPARTDCAYWRSSIIGHADVLFLKGRLRFGDGEDPAPFPSALVIWGADARLLALVREAFPGAAWMPRDQFPTTTAHPRAKESARSRVAVREARGGGSRSRVPGRGR